MYFTFAVFPQQTIVFEPTKRTLNNPSFWQNGECMEFITFYDFDFSADQYFYAGCERLSRITSVNQYFQASEQIGGCIANHGDCAVAVGYVRRADKHGVGQPKRINTDVKFYPGSFFPASKPFSSAVSVFLTLFESTMIMVVCSLRPSMTRSASTSLRRTRSSTLSLSSLTILHRL